MDCCFSSSDGYSVESEVSERVLFCSGFGFEIEIVDFSFGVILVTSADSPSAATLLFISYETATTGSLPF